MLGNFGERSNCNELSEQIELTQVCDQVQISIADIRFWTHAQGGPVRIHSLACVELLQRWPKPPQRLEIKLNANIYVFSDRGGAMGNCSHAPDENELNLVGR